MVWACPKKHENRSSWRLSCPVLGLQCFPTQIFLHKWIWASSSWWEMYGVLEPAWLWRNIVYQHVIIAALASPVSFPSLPQKHQHRGWEASSPAFFAVDLNHHWKTLNTFLVAGRALLLPLWKMKTLWSILRLNKVPCNAVWIALRVWMRLARGEGKISSVKKPLPSVLIFRVRGSYSSMWKSVNVGTLLKKVQ